MKSHYAFSLLILSALSSQAIELPQVAHEMGCSKCHAIDHKVVGPAWMDVSLRYRDNRDSQVVFNQLVKKVSKGGLGNWGDTPMVANDPLGKKTDKITELVKFILALSDQAPGDKK